MIVDKTATNRLQTVDGASFKELVLNGTGAIAVEFMSYGCGHCRVLEPILQHVADTISSREKFYRVNVAVEEDLASEYAIQGTPTLVMFLDGREVGRVEAPHPTVSSVMTAVTHPFETWYGDIASAR